MGVMDKLKETFGSPSDPLQPTNHIADPSTVNDTPNPTSSTTQTQSPHVPQLAESAVFFQAKITVIFVLGGPGAGPSSLFHSYDDILKSCREGNSMRATCRRLRLQASFR